MRNDAELFKDRIEVSLDGRQIFYLFFGAAVVASLVFVLGVMVGKRLEARSSPIAARSVASDPLAALDQLDADTDDGFGELVFPSALTGDAEPAVGQLGPLDAKLAAEERDDSRRAAQEAAERAKAKAEAKAEAEAKAKAEAEARAEARAEAKGQKVVEAEASTAKFTLQLSSFQDRAEADEFVGALTAAGYRPYLVAADLDDKGTWYRVRLGKYLTYNDALTAKAEFERKQKIIAYVTRIAR